MPLLVAPTSLNDKLQQQRFVILGEVFLKDIPVRIKENRYLELSPVAGRAKKVSAAIKNMNFRNLFIENQVNTQNCHVFVSHQLTCPIS